MKINPKIAILTVSDTRNLEDDFSGLKIAELLAAADIEVLERLIVQDDIEQIRTGFRQFSKADVIISNGGTGLAKRDVTFEALAPEISQDIPGFGEFFRSLSFAEIGTHAMASRAFAFFTAEDQLVFVLPGSTNACELATSKLIIPELFHLLKERRK